MNEQQATEVIGLLRAIALKLGARVPVAASQPTEEELRSWREVNRVRRGEDGGEYPSSTTTREEFFRKKSV